MIYKLIFNQVKKLFVLISISTLLTGCMTTQKALRKVNADRQFLGYESVYISKDMDIVLNYKVRFNKHGRFTGTDEIWCAKLPLEETYNQSKLVAELCRTPNVNYGQSLNAKILDEYKSVENIKISTCVSTDDKEIKKNIMILDDLNERHYSKINSKCNNPGDDFVSVLLLEHHNNPVNALEGSWVYSSDKTAPPIYFMSSRAVAIDDRAYLVFTEYESDKIIYKAVKVGQPLPYRKYDLLKMASTPFYMVLDVVAIPMYLFLIAVGPF